MVDQLEWVKFLILEYPSLQYLIIFLGAAVGGELALFTIAFLAAQGIISPVASITFSFLGALSADSMWFLLGRTTTAKKIILHRYANPTITVITKAIEKVSRGSHFWALVFAKFLVGTRIIILIYISNLSFSFGEFIRYNVIATIIWLAVIGPIGFLSGLGFTYVADIFQSLYAGVGFVLLILIVIVILQLWLKKIFIHMRNR